MLTDEGDMACCAACDEPLTTETELLTGFCSDHAFATARPGDPRPLNFSERYHTLADELPEIDEEDYPYGEEADEREDEIS